MKKITIIYTLSVYTKPLMTGIRERHPNYTVHCVDIPMQEQPESLSLYTPIENGSIVWPGMKMCRFFSTAECDEQHLDPLHTVLLLFTSSQGMH